MTRLHDMGGRFGDGPVIPEPDFVPFHEDWHARALALTIAGAYIGWWSIDAGRFSREALAPKDYARFSYYEKWLAGLADMLVEHGIVSREELAGADPVPAPQDIKDRKLSGEEVAAGIARGGPSAREVPDPPSFRKGDAVRVRAHAGNRMVPGGHTRQPQYVSGALGRIVMLHGGHVFPDASAHGLGEAPEHLYAVAFPASELWVHPEHPRDEVVLDLWQSYLDPA